MIALIFWVSNYFEEIFIVNTYVHTLTVSSSVAWASNEVVPVRVGGSSSMIILELVSSAKIGASMAYPIAGNDGTILLNLFSMLDVKINGE